MDKTTKLVKWQRITIAALILLLTVLSCHYYLYMQCKIGINFDNHPPLAETEESALFAAQEFVRGAFLGSAQPQDHPEIVFGQSGISSSPPFTNSNSRDRTQPWEVVGEIYHGVKGAKPLSWKVKQTWDAEHHWRLQSIHIDASEPISEYGGIAVIPGD